MAPAVKILFGSRTKSYFDANITYVGVILNISKRVLIKYILFHYFESWYNNSMFPSYQIWKNIFRYKILAFQSDT